MNFSSIAQYKMSLNLWKIWKIYRKPKEHKKWTQNEKSKNWKMKKKIEFFENRKKNQKFWKMKKNQKFWKFQKILIFGTLQKIGHFWKNRKFWKIIENLKKFEIFEKNWKMLQIFRIPSAIPYIAANEGGNGQNTTIPRTEVRVWDDRMASFVKTAPHCDPR